jgi:hypothetical protein
MIKAVLDASVAVAWYLPETFASRPRSWQRKLLEGDVELTAEKSTTPWVVKLGKRAKSVLK